MTAIERYLAELERARPFLGDRLVDETRSHLFEATERFVDSGVDLDTAATRAVDELGPVDAIVDAARANGGPTPLARLHRWVPPIAALLSVPTFVFIFVNTIEHLAGNDGGIGVFGDTFDEWQVPLNTVLTFGPFIGFLLIALTSIRVRFVRGPAGVAARVDIRLTRWLVGVGAFCLVVGGGIVAHLVSQNILCVPGSSMCLI